MINIYNKSSLNASVHNAVNGQVMQHKIMCSPRRSCHPSASSYPIIAYSQGARLDLIRTTVSVMCFMYGKILRIQQVYHQLPHANSHSYHFLILCFMGVADQLSVGGIKNLN